MRKNKFAIGEQHQNVADDAVFQFHLSLSTQTRHIHVRDRHALVIVISGYTRLQKRLQ
jgi:hypothetical protein